MQLQAQSVISMDWEQIYWTIQAICKLRRLRVTFFLSCKSNKYYTFWVCVCNLTYPRTRRNNIVICVPSGCTIFFYIILQTVRFSEKCYWMFDFPYNCDWNIYQCTKNSARCYHTCTVHISVCFMWSTGYSCQILMKLELYQQIFLKC